MDFVYILLAACLTLLFASGRAAPNPGVLQGWFTHAGNNPALQCNRAVAGETYENVIVEARINFFENEDDDRYTGDDCEYLWLDNCDLNAAINIDTEEPLSNWPENMPMTEVVAEWDGNDIKPNNQQYPVGSKQHAYTACKLVPQLSLATIRVAIVDLDVGVSPDVVNNFNCHWAPQYVGMNARDAKWETINCCTAFRREMKGTVKHELKVDVRVYSADRDDGQQCQTGRRP